ncbi:MAG: adenylate/guanylate cyclase domain-containing protein [Actinomycetota bacterium]
MSDSDDQPAIAELNTKANLARLLDELAENPERIDTVTQRVKEMFGERRAILVLDMSGFTRATQRGDLISYLLMINQMQRLAVPTVEKHGGIFVRADHDNLTCLFDEVLPAIEAARTITAQLETVNVVLPADRELYVSIGIGFGSILNVENQIVYGNQVNLASKLGEDIGQLGDILLTENAYRRVEDEDVKCMEHNVAISGIDVCYYEVTG